MSYWDSMGASEDNILTIAQRDEDAFEAAVGQDVNEYAFAYLLPREEHRSTDVG